MCVKRPPHCSLSLSFILSRSLCLSICPGFSFGFGATEKPFNNPTMTHGIPSVCWLCKVQGRGEGSWAFCGKWNRLIVSSLISADPRMCAARCVCVFLCGCRCVSCIPWILQLTLASTYLTGRATRIVNFQINFTQVANKYLASCQRQPERAYSHHQQQRQQQQHEQQQQQQQQKVTAVAATWKLFCYRWQ